MAKVSPGEFVRQVRQEVSKVTWSTRKETTITGMMVFIMVAVLSIFFFGIDHLLALLVQWILSLGA